MTHPTPTPENPDSQSHTESAPTANEINRRLPLRFHRATLGLHSVFGNDWFGLKSEKFARFFGTPGFLLGQTLIVGIWITINVVGWTRFDAYPFILLNLMFSLQAAYAAPLILLAQTRQADRDKALALADAQHREALALAAEQNQAHAVRQTAQLVKLMKQNTELTELTRELSERIEAMTREMHGKVVGNGGMHPQPDGQ